jgi:hypothetical protein
MSHHDFVDAESRNRLPTLFEVLSQGGGAKGGEIKVVSGSEQAISTQPKNVSKTKARSSCGLRGSPYPNTIHCLPRGAQFVSTPLISLSVLQLD